MLAIDTYTIKDGIMIKKATEEHPDASKRKIIIANKASFVGAFIDDGRLSLTGNHKFYIIGDKLELVIKMLNYKIIDIVSHYTKYGQDFLDNESFAYLPDIRKLNVKDIDEKKLYKLIGLTHNEIKSFDKNNTDNNVKIDKILTEKISKSKNNIDIIDDDCNEIEEKKYIKKNRIKKNKIDKNNNDIR